MVPKSKADKVNLASSWPAPWSLEHGHERALSTGLEVSPKHSWACFYTCFHLNYKLIFKIMELFNDYKKVWSEKKSSIASISNMDVPFPEFSLWTANDQCKGLRFQCCLGPMVLILCRSHQHCPRTSSNALREAGGEWH